MSQDHGGDNVVYRRDQGHKIELPVPNYSGSDHSMQLRSFSDVEKRSGLLNLYDNLLGESYNSFDHSDSPSSGNSLALEGYMSVSTNYPREQFRNHGNVYNGMTGSSLAPQQPLEMPPRHPSTHFLDDMEKSAVPLKVPPSKQIEEYKKKASLLREELEILRNQRNELRGHGTRSPSPDTRRYLKDNAKLQVEIQNQLKTITNVLDMVTGVMGHHAMEPQEQPPSESKPNQKWNQKFNYVFYDPEMHWCRVCDVFPLTAKDYLSHLHSSEHQLTAAEHAEAPWHSVAGVDEGYPSLPTAPTKRTPIRGLQFFVPATAWYCKLCDQFIGDLHCASAHIKSIVHSKNYNKFVHQNPHWETDWMSDRQRAFERSRVENKHAVEDGAHVKQQFKYFTHTVTISKDVQTKRPPTTPPLELEGRQTFMSKRKPNRSISLSSISESETEETILNENSLKRMEVVEDREVDSLDSPAASASRLTDDDRKLLEALRTRKSDNRDRSSDARCIRDRSNDRRRERSRDRSNDRRRDRSSDETLRRSRDRTAVSRDRRGRSRDRRGGNRDRRDGSRDRRGGSRDRRSGSRERKNYSRRRSDSKKHVAPPLPLMSIQLSSGLPMPTAAMPRVKLPNTAVPQITLPNTSVPRVKSPNTAVPQITLPNTSVPPPLPFQPNQPPPEISKVLQKDFQGPFKGFHPTDPYKRTEMLNVMQQPGLLGPPPSLPHGFPFGYATGMFPFDFTAANAGLYLRPPVPLLFGPHMKLIKSESKSNQSGRATQTLSQLTQAQRLLTTPKSQPTEYQNQTIETQSQPTETQSQLAEAQSQATQPQLQSNVAQTQSTKHLSQLTHPSQAPLLETKSQCQLTQPQSEANQPQSQPTYAKSQSTQALCQSAQEDGENAKSDQSEFVLLGIDANDVATGNFLC